MDLDARGVERLSQNAHILCLSAVLITLLMALPPIWYLRDLRKMRSKNAK